MDGNANAGIRDSRPLIKALTYMHVENVGGPKVFKKRKPINKKLLTRKEIIEIWRAQGDVFQETYCCPNCKNLLFMEVDLYYCFNQDCNMYDIPMCDIPMANKV